MKKKLGAVILAAAIFTGITTFSTVAAEDGISNTRMPDNPGIFLYPSTWALEEVNTAINAGLVPQSLQEGYGEQLTRAEFCALAVALYEKCVGEEITERRTFDDIDDINVEKAGAIGVVLGVGDNLFEPDAIFRQEQAATMLARLAEAIGKPLENEDAPPRQEQAISPWALESVRQVLAAGIMESDGVFLPKTRYDREQGIGAILRLYEYYLGYSLSKYDVEYVTVGAGTEYELSGKLTIPSGVTPDTPCPAVVLVQGSGSSDMDETIYANKGDEMIGANKPFFDIADYLSSNGIAVIRYNKRTFTYGEKMVEESDGSLTVMEETIEDAILATEMLKSDPRIDKDRIFIIGHSLGGMLAPRIHAEGGDYAGLILLAGSPRFLLNISKDQNIAYIEAMPDGEEKETLLEQMLSWDLQIAIMLSLSDEAAKETPMGGGVSVYYYQDMYKHPASEYIKEITVPFLVLQGSKDFQIYPDKDFALYKELLGDRSNVTFKLYDGLNHLFMTSTTGTIEEYEIKGHVDVQVLEDIVQWINTN